MFIFLDRNNVFMGKDNKKPQRIVYMCSPIGLVQVNATELAEEVASYLFIPGVLKKTYFPVDC